MNQLPGESASAGGDENGNQFAPTESTSAPTEALPPPQPAELPPLSAVHIPSAEFQFGVAGRADHVRSMVADGRLRRLPIVDRDQPQTVLQTATAPADLFLAPPSTPAPPLAAEQTPRNPEPRVARRLPSTEIR